MSKLCKLFILSVLLLAGNQCMALNEYQADKMADLTAIFVYLKNDCHFNDIPDRDLRHGLIIFAQKHNWDLANYKSMNMQQRGINSYLDLKQIALNKSKKCRLLAENTLGLLSYLHN